MDGAVRQAKSLHRGLGGSHDGVLRGRIFARRRNVEGLFEEWAVQRIGLVEQRKHAELAVRQDAFERELAAFDEALYLKKAVLILVQPRDIGICQQAFDPAERHRELGRVVGADYSTAGGQSERF